MSTTALALPKALKASFTALFAGKVDLNSLAFLLYFYRNRCTLNRAWRIVSLTCTGECLIINKVAAMTHASPVSHWLGGRIWKLNTGMAR